MELTAEDQGNVRNILLYNWSSNDMELTAEDQGNVRNIVLYYWVQ